MVRIVTQVEMPWNEGRPTLVAWFQLGEFRLFSIGEISDRGRGIELAILTGDPEDTGVFLEMRSG